MYKLFIVIAIACYLYKFLSQKDVFLLIHGKKDFNADVLKMLDRTELVYKVRSNAYDHMDYNNKSDDHTFVVVGRRFGDDISLKQYVSIIRHFEFVEEIKEVTTLVANYDVILNGYNLFQSLWASIGGALDFVPERPFQGLATSPRMCPPEDARSEDEIHTISLLKVANKSEMAMYTNFILWKAFPAFNIQVGYNGKPESDYWTTFAIFRYKHHKDFCELITSELFEKHVAHKYKAVEDSHAYVVKPI